MVSDYKLLFFSHYHLPTSSNSSNREARFTDLNLRFCVSADVLHVSIFDCPLNDKSLNCICIMCDRIIFTQNSTVNYTPKRPVYWTIFDVVRGHGQNCSRNHCSDGLSTPFLSAILTLSVEISIRIRDCYINQYFFSIIGRSGMPAIIHRGLFFNYIVNNFGGLPLLILRSHRTSSSSSTSVRTFSSLISSLSF